MLQGMMLLEAAYRCDRLYLVLEVNVLQRLKPARITKTLDSQDEVVYQCSRSTCYVVTKHIIQRRHLICAQNSREESIVSLSRLE